MTTTNTHSSHFWKHRKRAGKKERKKERKNERKKERKKGKRKKERKKWRTSFLMSQPRSWRLDLVLDIPTMFLDASTHLYKRVCPSISRSVRLSVCESVRPSRVFFKSRKLANLTNLTNLNLQIWQNLTNLSLQFNLSPFLWTHLCLLLLSVFFIVSLSVFFQWSPMILQLILLSVLQISLHTMNSRIQVLQLKNCFFLNWKVY